MNCYRVWMRDGYARLIDAESEAEARDIAVKLTTADINGAAMTKTERRLALTVDYVECLTAPSKTQKC